LKQLKITKEDYDLFRIFLEGVSGIVLGDNKHYLVSSRLNRLMNDNNIESYSDLIDILRENRIRGFTDQVVDAMTTNETMWFRDTYPYEALKNTVFPQLDNIDHKLRIWSSACSSGQEPYSISMIVDEYIKSSLGAFKHGVEVVATDISLSVLEQAKKGIYDESAMNRGITEERKRQYFNRIGDLWEIKPEINSRITFKTANLQESYAHLGKFDIIFCRNVLIYFSSEMKTEILNKMAACLNDNGFLLLGSSEAPNRYTDAFEMVRVPQGVIYRVL